MTTAYDEVWKDGQLISRVEREAVDEVALIRAAAKALLDADSADDKRFKAFVLVVLDEFNLHAAKTNAILTAIDNASTLANLKTAIAAINDFPTRTVDQLKTAMRNKIDSGDAD